MTKPELEATLNSLHDKYNRPEFIENDPISIPHSFTNQKEREISGLLASTIAWGNRKAIVKSAKRMIALMDNCPFEFTMNASDVELRGVERFVHRTFNGQDFRAFIIALRHLYTKYPSLGAFFEMEFAKSNDIKQALIRFREEFFIAPHDAHCEKHVSDVGRKSAAKRLNMFLRWFVRKDDRGVDFGLWNIPMSALYLPLDVHSGNTARTLGLLDRKANDWKAVEEVTAALRQFDPNDPVKYDFALFGAGVNKNAKLKM